MSALKSNKASEKRRVGRPSTNANPRAAILQAAATLFSEQGYETSSLGDLAASMQMSKASIYHYFTTKQEIYDAIILETLEGLLGAVSVAVEPIGCATDKLRIFMITHARFFEANRAGFVVMLVGFDGIRRSQFINEAMRVRDGYEQLLRSIIETGIEQGALRQINAVSSARAILSLLNWLVRWFKPGAGKTAEEIVLEYYDLIEQGMSARP